MRAITIAKSAVFSRTTLRSLYHRRRHVIACLVGCLVVAMYLLRTYYAWQIVLYDSMFRSTAQNWPCVYEEDARDTTAKQLNIAILVLYDGDMYESYTGGGRGRVVQA
jgi:hypothetical protein